ncbi:hypothetical protein L2Y94_14965 [Luteibacter aegosomatis]|uniref:hypothetical protein n=1 Tax=Luteibacter aegosomatis TaxID=2911537 RepID=UPI001FFA2A21|nr:hypothetical protein [Luteibacter aegosomatis]UPG84621.1 hypothetical protein L2Y94_14965 [Luteibacter aegosomatis]
MALIDKDAVLRFAQLCTDAIVMNDAALASAFDEARFRARMIADWALERGRSTIADTAADIERILGPSGMEPGLGYGDAMIRLAKIMTP